MNGSLKSVLVLSVLMLGFALPVAAQDVPKIELSGGYQVLNDRSAEETFPAGWYVDVAGNVTRMFGIVGEVGGSYKTLSDLVDVKLKVHTFMAGVRVSSRANAKVVPFAQALVGGWRAGGSVGILGISVGASETDAALQVGGGVNVMATGNVGIRLGADYRRVFTEDEGTNEARFVVGVVLPFGKK